MKKQLVSRFLFENKVYNNTYKALVCLFENSYYTQLTLENRINDLCEWKEFCTIRMTSSRQSGHTFSIAKLSLEYFDSAILLSANQDMSNHMFETIKNLQNNPEFFTKVTPSTLRTSNGQYLFGTYENLDRYRGVTTEAIFIEGTFNLTPKKEDDIYRTLGPCMARNPQKFFIFVQ